MDLTIIVPTRNRNGRVVECVHALEHNESDIVIVDDASDTPVVLPSSKARIIRHNRKLGRSAAINTGLEAALHDAVLIMDDDIYAAPDMVLRLLDEFTAQKNPKLGVTARVAWDPDCALTLTMAWMEKVEKFVPPMLFSRAFLLANGGYDENFTRTLEDTELELRLKQQGLEIRRLPAAVGFHHRVVKVRDLVDREFNDGQSAVFVHAKFPQFMPQIEDLDMLLKNEARAADAATAVDELALLEQSAPPELQGSVADLYGNVCHHYFLRGVFDALRDIGGMKRRRNSTSTLAIYRQASHLEETGELDEARRLFSLVLQRNDEKYWDGAEYHLGCIEMTLRNPEAAHGHFLECLRLNPAHHKARRALFKPGGYRETEANVFVRMDRSSRNRVLFILFGDLGHVVNAFPVVAALSRKYQCETAWLTSAEHAELARASMICEVHEMKTRGLIPWDWIHSEGFTHVFFPEPGANLEEFERSALHPTDFMAKKCGVQVHSRRPQLEVHDAVTAEAEAFLQEKGLERDFFITASQGDGEARHWPKSNLAKLAQQTALPMIVFGKKGDSEIRGTISCLDKSPEVIAVLIGWSSFYLGPAYGISWLATATDTPAGIFFDPQDCDDSRRFFKDSREDRQSVQEWSIYTNLRIVADELEAAVAKHVCGRG